MSSPLTIDQLNGRFLTTKDIAARLGVRPALVWAWYRRGLIRGYRFGERTIRFTEDAVNEFLARQNPDVETLDLPPSILAELGETETEKS